MILDDLVAARAKALRHGETVPFDIEWPAELEQLWFMLGDAEHIRTAANDLVNAIRTELASRLRENEAVRFGDTVYRMSVDRKERVIDPRALADWLRDDWHHVVPLSHSTPLKKTGLRAICERRGVEYETVRDSFIDVEWGGPKLSAIPIDRAPKYARGLEHGESTYD